MDELIELIESSPGPDVHQPCYQRVIKLAGRAEGAASSKPSALGFRVRGRLTAQKARKGRLRQEYYLPRILDLEKPKQRVQA